MGTQALKQQKQHTGLNLILVIALTAMLLPTLAGTAGAAPAIPDGDVAGLYAAITAANASGNPTTIKLANNGTYILNATPLNIFGAITIQGQGATIDAAGSGRVFNVAPSGDLTLDDLTITGGLTDSIGGGIYNSPGSVTLNNSSSVNHNTVGGIYNDGGTVNQYDSSTVLHNDSYDIENVS